MTGAALAPSAGCAVGDCVPPQAEITITAIASACLTSITGMMRARACAA